LVLNMLEELLRALGEGGILGYEELARRLSVPPSLLEMMLEDLTRRGYLHPVDYGCSGGCHSCSMRVCSIAGPGRLWSLTEKGARATARLAA
jgi:hypothetical protein